MVQMSTCGNWKIESVLGTLWIWLRRFPNRILTMSIYFFQLYMIKYWKKETN